MINIQSTEYSFTIFIPEKDVFSFSLDYESIHYVERNQFKSMDMSEIQRIVNSLIKFRDQRDWGQFHNPKDLSIALSIEANELMELFLWKKEDELQEVDLAKIKEELADVFSFAFLLLEKYDFDLEEIIKSKIEQNARKYPIDKAKGVSTKYNSFDK